jgi:hypothetical protein
VLAVITWWWWWWWLRGAVVEKMLARLKVLAEEMVEPQQWVAPFQGESYFCKDCPLHPGGTGVGHAWGPWIQ